MRFTLLEPENADISRDLVDRILLTHHRCIASRRKTLVFIADDARADATLDERRWRFDDRHRSTALAAPRWRNSAFAFKSGYRYADRIDGNVLDDPVVSYPRS